MDCSFSTGQLYVWDKLFQYTGPIIPSETLDLPDDMKIAPWVPLRSMALLTIQGVTVAGPARLELMRSYAYELCNSPEKEHELAAIRREVDTVIQREVR
ncbi:MAG: hypothetical protein KAR44_12515 [Candidatus Aegiribacteria sp.]|nr:hypothetical protein [Candidatus Aegiribacteria sp.]